MKKTIYCDTEGKCELQKILLSSCESKIKNINEKNHQYAAQIAKNEKITLYDLKEARADVERRIDGTRLFGTFVSSLISLIPFIPALPFFTEKFERQSNWIHILKLAMEKKSRLTEIVNLPTNDLNKAHSSLKCNST